MAFAGHVLRGLLLLLLLRRKVELLLLLRNTRQLQYIEDSGTVW